MENYFLMAIILNYVMKYPFKTKIKNIKFQQENSWSKYSQNFFT